MIPEVLSAVTKRSSEAGVGYHSVLAERHRVMLRIVVDPSEDDWIAVVPENRQGVVGFRWVRAAIL